MPEELDPISLTLIIIYNAVIFGMVLKWAIPEIKRLIGREYE